MTKTDYSYLKEWLALPDDTKKNIYTQAGTKIGLPAFAIEKDWWVVHALSLIFETSCSEALIFKGGTSLSKAWNTIERFSEDIDLAIDREYLGFKGDLSKRKINKLREKSKDFLFNQFLGELTAKFHEVGINNIKLHPRETGRDGQDPITIELHYNKLIEDESYLKPGVLIEIGCRSLKEPYSIMPISTMVAEAFPERPFIDPAISVPLVNPERTFLEKVILLHEEFKKNPEKIRVERLSRHLYDIEKLSQTKFAAIALQSPELFSTIVFHRSKFTPVTGTDYTNLKPDQIQFLPPENLLKDWEADYNKMLQDMIHDEGKLPFQKLMERLEHVQRNINQIA